MSHICEYCKQDFTRKYGLVKHLEQNRCKQLKMQANEIVTALKKTKGSLKEKVIAVKKQLTEKKDHIDECQTNELTIVKEEMAKLGKKMAELIEKRPLTDQSPSLTETVAKLAKEFADFKEKPRINNQILQVVCVGQNDNYLDMLTEQLGNFDKALEYITNCALSDLSGDCKLIGKMYLNGADGVQFADKNRTKITYYNENKEEVCDSKELFGKKIANNLQKSYLKGVNYLINQTLENRRCPNKFLEEYDLQTWNQHIFNLSDIKYQKQLVNHLDIPVRSRNS